MQINSAELTKNKHKNGQMVEKGKQDNIDIAFFVKSAIINIQFGYAKRINNKRRL